MKKGKNNKQRSIFKISITPKAKDVLEKIPEELGITQIALTSQMIIWFSKQPDEIKAAILGLYPDLLDQDIGKTVMQRMQRGLD